MIDKAISESNNSRIFALQSQAMTPKHLNRRVDPLYCKVERGIQYMVELIVILEWCNKELSD
jgi:hypothetical protein